MEITDRELRKLTVHFLFQGVPPELLRETLKRYGEGLREFGSGETVLSPGGQLQTAGVLLSGRAAVTTPDPSHAVLLRFLGAGDVFGVAGLFSGEPFVSLIRAESRCRCVLFSETAVAHLLDASGEFRAHYIGFLNSRIRFLNRKIGYLTAGSAERRLALYLASLGKGEVCLQDSITSLSDLLNLGRASLYRAFDRLCQDGYLTRNGRKLTIPDPEAMLNAYH